MRCFFLCGFLLCSLMPAVEIPFEHVIVDGEVTGQRQVADVDGDGSNDIVVRSENQLLWYRYPDWTKHVIVEEADFAGDDVEVGDIDGDGDMDIVATIGSDGQVYWYQNPKPAGDPATAAWQRHSIGASQESKTDVKKATHYVAPSDETRYVKDMEVADFDRDGALDVVTRTHGDVYVWLQRDSSRWEMVHLGIRYHEGMDVGDLDRDGDPDIVLNGYWIETPDDLLNGTWVEHNIDSKWWAQGPTESWTDDNSKVAVADMNQDGYPDVVLSHSEKPGYPVSWYEARGDPKSGRWREHVIGQIDYCHSLQAADMDNDGDMDVVAGALQHGTDRQPDTSHPLVVFINEGNALRWTQQVVTTLGNYSAQIGDIDNDGDIDVVGLRRFNRPPIEIWRNKTSDEALSMDTWTYFHVDDSRSEYVVPWSFEYNDVQKWWRYLGLALGDLTGDGYGDIASGRYFYRNPGGDMSAPWTRVRFPVEVDAMLMVDVDGDEYGDIIGQALPDVYWLEANDREGSSWTALRIATMPQTGHGNTQGYTVAQMVAGGKPELVMGAEDGISYFEIPTNPSEGNWPRTLIATHTSGLTVGDIDGDGDIDVASTDVSLGNDRRRIAWWRNPGNGSGRWIRFLVGRTDGDVPDRFAIADINGDGRNDIVVTEEMGPAVPEANTYWFEQPANPTAPEWPRHTVATQFTTNAMDVADIDRDGDPDIITGEHRGTKKVIIWENPGDGSSWTPHLVSEGKESHLGARVVDLDGDGDLDIVSICWDAFQDLHLWRNDARAGETSREVDGGRSYLAGAFKYRLPITVGAAGHERFDKVIELDLNFTQLARQLGEPGAFDETSLHVVEVNARGDVSDAQVMFQFDKSRDFDSESKALGTLVLMLEGTTPADGVRRYEVYWGRTEGAWVPPSVPEKVSVTDGVMDEGYESFQIHSENATYFYHKRGSAFSSIVDNDGNDWVGYHPEGGPAGSYRGIPNLAPADFHPGPGEGNLESEVVSAGPLKLRILSQTADRKWACTWDIYPTYAKMTLFKTDERPFWLLYEGTPGGSLDAETDYWVHSSGERAALAQDWEGELPAPEWVYFGDGGMRRVLYFIHHEDDTVPDQFFPMQGNMTVFGFGREFKGMGMYLTTVPTHLTIGFAEDGTYLSRAKKVIEGAYKEVKISAGVPEVNGHRHLPGGDER